MLSNSSGAKVESTEYLPFGPVRLHTGSTLTNYKYTDQELDPETGLYYYNARYYDPMIGRFISADSIVPNPGNPQHLNRYAYADNNPLIYIDPTGHFSLKKFLKSVFSGFVGGAVFVFTGNPVLAGMAAGAVGGALSGGGIEGILQGAVIGGVAGGLYMAGVPGELLLGAGAIAATATGGLDGLAYFAGGMMGGIAGAVWASNLTMPTVAKNGQPVEDDPLNYDGKQLTATDANGEKINSWEATSGRPGSTTSVADQLKSNYGTIPAGKYSVNPQNIQRWSDLPLHQKIAAYFGRGLWRGGVPAWGHTRVPIDSSSVLIRGNFYIHGGSYPGSAGCIDLGANEASFFNYFSVQRGNVPLTVNYGP